jgi:flavoprotein
MFLRLTKWHLILRRWILGEDKMKKVLTTVRPLVEQGGKAKFCVHCGHTATQEALFKVDESVILLERYCDTCIKIVK